MTNAFLFPGQGSQSVGMGRAVAESWPEARAVFEEVDEALGERLSDTIWNGPDDALTLTRNAQPALMAVSIAAMRAIAAEGVSLRGHAAYVAGHSLGEYSALVAAEALTLADAARLLRLRGDAMQAAVPVGEGAMAAILGLDFEAAREVAREASEGDVCEAANDNAPGQVVISGGRAAVARAAERATARGAKRAMLLPVSAPFHSSLMRPAADAMRDALADTRISHPVVPVVANVVAEPVSDPDAIRRLLVEQVTGTVRWRESIVALERLGVRTAVEAGAGRVLAGLVKRIAPGIATLPAATPDEIRAAATRFLGA